ncbi:hypothetical protein L3X38_012768 [Prunus dulcis]|uniref:Uncharacterized protein n=1 Tax=Prunus dulcis TaxID=3755 RepID=A0AAD4WKP3_PRUDU|nr:hypothetical protein L3X38_012768 [Prunus dulcis]
MVWLNSGRHILDCSYFTSLFPETHSLPLSPSNFFLPQLSFYNPIFLPFSPLGSQDRALQDKVKNLPWAEPTENSE